MRYLLRTARDTEALGGVDWPALRFVVAEVFFGGAITDDHDARVARSYGDVWFKSQMVAGGQITASSGGRKQRQPFRLAGAGIIPGSTADPTGRRRRGPNAKVRAR